MCAYISTPPLEQNVTQGQFFKLSLTGFKNIFLHLNQLPYQGLRAQSAQLFNYSWRENPWIHTFLKILALCEMQTASSRFELGSLCPFPIIVVITPYICCSLCLSASDRITTNIENLRDLVFCILTWLHILIEIIWNSAQVIWDQHRTSDSKIYNFWWNRMR